MYNCDKCGEVHKGKQNKRVSEIRNVIYDIFLLKGYRGGVERKPYFFKNTQGWEIVKEQQLCDICAKVLAEVPPKVTGKEKVVECLGTKPKEKLEEEAVPYRNDFEREKYEEVKQEGVSNNA
jgi:hypothetical protein